VIISDEKNITSQKLLNDVSILKNSLLKISESYRNKRVYIDIKERYLFIILFFTLMDLKAKIVLLPIEIKNEDYYFPDIFYISDNKKSDFGLYLNQELTVESGSLFNDTNVIEDNDTFLYLYTSGSTGKAKLIPKSYENILTELTELKRIFNVTENDIFYFTPPLYHIYGILFGLFLPIYCNSKLIIDYHFTPDTISLFVKNHKITFFVSIPSYYKMFCDLGLIDDFNNTKRLASSSAPLPLQVSQNFYEKSIEITEIYGSTETGGIAHRVSAKDLEWHLFSYIKIIDSDMLIENSENKNFKELVIDSKAVSNVYDKKYGYNTGDIVEFFDNNKFALVGRNTRFVKISGKRVNLKYIEKKFIEYIYEITNIKITEDSVYAGENNEKIFIFYEIDLKKDTNTMKHELKNHLPGYAIPRYYFCQKIPRNEMGKINKVKIEEIVAKLSRDISR